jgi:excisionase family DNA binding protein
MSVTTPELKGWLTTQEVADRYNCPTRVVLRMIREGRLTASKLGWQWVVHESSLPASWPPPPIRVAS